MNDTSHGMDKVQHTKKLADSRFHILKGHDTSRDVFQQLCCIYPQRLMDETDMAAMGAIHKEVTKHFPNEFPTRMMYFNRVKVVIDVQFMFPCLAQGVYLQDDVCRITGSFEFRMT